MTLSIVGLADFQRELKRMDAQFPKEMRLVNKSAADIIAETTRKSFASRGGVAPKVVPSIKALAQQRSAAVKIGGTKYPFAMGTNFGSREFTQFPPPAKPDYSLYRSIAQDSDRVVASYGDAIERLAARAFPQ